MRNVRPCAPPRLPAMYAQRAERAPVRKDTTHVCACASARVRLRVSASACIAHALRAHIPSRSAALALQLWPMHARWKSAALRDAVVSALQDALWMSAQTSHEGDVTHLFSFDVEINMLQARDVVKNVSYLAVVVKACPRAVPPAGFLSACLSTADVHYGRKLSGGQTARDTARWATLEAVKGPGPFLVAKHVHGSIICKR